MAEITLAAETGRPTGSRSSGRVRTEGKVPGVVYGHGMEPVPVAIDRRDLRAALHTDAGHNALINLDLGGGTGHLTIVKELQRHPVRNDVVHVDFIVVRRDEVVTVEVPVVLTGHASSVVSAGGTVDQQHHTLTVHATPGDIPDEISVDVSGLRIGDAVRVGDLRLPAGVTTDIDDEEVVVLAQVSAASVEADLLDIEAAVEAAEATDAPDVAGGGGGADAPAAEAGEAAE